MASTTLYQQYKFFLAWKLLNAFPRRRWQPANPARKILIVPPDPWSLTGSRGDEAMIQAVIDKMSSGLSTQPQFAIVVATDKAASAAKGLGVLPLQAWGGFTSTTRALMAYEPDAVIIIGADCMDGYYSPLMSSRLVATADVLARLGVPVAFTGFSFNEQPNPLVVRAFNRLTDAVQVNLRDAVSLGRFQKSSRHAASLVADAAFMLKPIENSENVASVRDWVVRRRATGAPVVVFNVHPHLIKDGSGEGLQSLIASASGALGKVLVENDVSILLLAHDYRERDGDDRCLGDIHRNLEARYGRDRLFYPKGPFTAAELKAIASCVDGVITGRMHLAIASLGMGVPISAIAYQGKFNGLLKHFSYPQDMQIGAADAVDEAKLYALIKRFLASLHELRSITQTALPTVKRLSLNNFRSFLPNDGVPATRA